ncbi:DNA polymerase III subunit epsilon [Vibrio fluvialis]|uniref:DNA polymerase III subunit epsilon n=1 Tax=Vibrio fluvialis TaxID=676 RepID=A0AAX2LU76_VIBFL|nr:exonuclease domain-containing protein [Vibrio fluvialis]AMF92107.1 DNA polymerase III subunit epsilon [Vibrio fluvialis]EKO4009592.1 DNA polymerase III subunit epsilon [Vibrio fluvialis]ELI5717827.1 DNA polymerase III subunit epsilon [Vibrio fluvialis]ELV8696065.1 DNA polymerase III subunit epsilon [Vibrio fluvialis]MBY8226139.1 DNA polymerase III subunit epsilon [Vibrio fluvialis]
MLNALKRRFGGGYHKMVKQHQLLAARRDWPTGLEHYFSQALPSPEALVYQMDMVAFDFETSGVNASQDQILSIGWVGMTMDHIDVAASEELFVRHPEFVTADSAVINHITPDVLSQGVMLDDAMDQLFNQLAGKIALVHGACIERAFVAQYMRERFGVEHFPCVWIDTLHIEKQMTYAGKKAPGTSFQLNDVRQRYALPQYTAHSAAIDALATAELFTAQMKSLFKNHPPKLSKLIAP